MVTNKKITELPAATLPIATGVKFEAVQGGINVQVDADDMPGSGGGTSIPFGSTSGTNTYTIAATPAVTAYTNGMLLHVKVVNGSTNVSTFNFDSVGAKKVYLTPDTQITVGMLVSNHEYLFTYDSTLDSAVGGFLLVGDYNHGLLNSRTNSFDASGGAYPSTLGSGPAGAIKHFDAYMVSVAGQMPGGGPFVKARDWLIALVDTPGNTAANWGYIISQKLYQATGSGTDGSMDQNSVTNALALKAPLASPTLTGTPTAPTAAAGDASTQLATTEFVQDTLYADVKLANRIGQVLAPAIYGSGSSIPLSTVVGGLTLTLGTEVFTIAAGSNGSTFVNYVLFNALVTSLSKYKILSQVTTGTTDANSRGYYIGVKNVQAGSGNDVVFHFDSSSGATGGKALIYENGTLIATSSGTMATFASAALLYEVIRDKDTFTFNVYGPSNEKITVSYAYDLAAGTVIKPGCSKFILGSLSTQNRNVYNFRVESDEIVFSDVLYVGDSITNGYYAGSEANSFPRLMEATGRVVAVSASNGAQTIDVFLWTSDFYLVKPKKAVLMIGTNDAIGAVAQFTFGVRHWNIYNALKASGADVWVVNLPPISTTDVTAYNTTLANRYGQTGRLIDVFSLLKGAGTDWNATYGSNSHPNQAGHLLIHQTILAALFP